MARRHVKKVPGPIVPVPPDPEQPPDPITGTTPYRAYEFHDSVGVNVHIGYTNTIYNDIANVKLALQKLGVLNIRESWGINTQSNARLGEIYSELGVKFIALLDPRFGNFANYGAALDYLIANNLDAMTAIEGPNEWDNNSGAGGTVAARMATVANEAQLIWNAYLARPLSHLPVYAPSAAQPNNIDLMGNIANRVTHGNIHSYSGGDTPDASSRGPNVSLTGQMNHALVAAPGKPIVATETGYHNAINATVIPGGRHNPTSERVAGIYALQEYMTYFKRGVKRTFVYELVNQFVDPELNEQEKNFGLFRNDWSEKPAATVIKNGIALLRDNAANRATFTVAPLAFTLAGPTTLRTMLTQKASGTWWLSIWNDVSIYTPSYNYNPPTGEITVADVTATLTIDSFTPAVLRIYRPHVSQAVAQTGGKVTNIAIPAATPILVEIDN